ncbi:MAG: UDP-N-acetylmuramoyl-L-alanine--D-glutamate ligase [Clostridia bacterium]|nr:UDP-N-acetylmuramoyl-L-alanine--D-glutamate ligase [Clostridia bacterium]
MYNFKDKKVLIIGLARSGIASLDALLQKGAIVSVQDSKTIDKLENTLVDKLVKNNVGLFLGVTPENEKFDYVVISPGVDPELPFVENLRNNGAEVIGELELAFRLCESNFVGITGTNGKTTTTSLVGEIFAASGRKSHVVGNIGLPVVTYAKDAGNDEYFVTEVSSFQLQTTESFRPHVAAILNITPDHLNRHHTFENYALTKAGISKKQDENDYLVLNYDDEYCFSMKQHSKAKIVPFSRKTVLDFGAFLDGNDLIIKDNGMTVKLVSRDEINLVGDHNTENCLAAAAICYFSGIDTDVIRSVLKTFTAVEHRMEYVRTIDDVKYYNDSKGTNVDATVIALRAIKKNIILIAGGDAKSQDFTDLASELKGKVKHITFFGRDRQMIIDACRKVGFDSYSEHETLEECVKYAKEIAENGDTVLLSPACASWDMYPNFEVRGEEFKKIVNNL